MSAALTPILALVPEWMALRSRYNSMESGPEAEAVWAEMGKVEDNLRRLPCVGPADFAAKFLVVEDISPLEDREDVVDREACELVRATLSL